MLVDVVQLLLLFVIIVVAVLVIGYLVLDLRKKGMFPSRH